jgi:predicted Rossmann fold flavoprotein
MSETWDVVVVGGGPAGMMAAGRAAERGARVLLLEKNSKLGKKLLITGGGRCNMTNAEFDNRKLLAHFKESADYLHSAFAQWSVQETLDFFHHHHLDTKTEALQRVFPITEQAESVWQVLVDYLQSQQVTVQSSSPVVALETENNQISAVRLKNGKRVVAKHYILATGGRSHPETGSTGEGFKWLSEIGHTVIEPEASLVPVTIAEKWIKQVSGITLERAKVTLLQNGVKQGRPRLGRILFTHFGLSGPTILNLSHEISELLKYGEVTISLDLLPGLDYGQLNSKLQEILREEHNNKKFRNSLGSLVPAALAPIIVELSAIDPETWSHSVTREQRLALVQLLKAIPLTVSGLLGLEKAVITAGGVKLDEVDFKTMHSRLYPNLSLIGDVLNIDRPSGGYSLQLCWTTGFVAGNAVELN